MSETGIEDLYACLRRALNAWDHPFTPRTRAAEVPGWDSLHHMLLLMEIEERFGVALTAEETGAMPDVGALWQAIEERRGA